MSTTDYGHRWAGADTGRTARPIDGGTHPDGLESPQPATHAIRLRGAAVGHVGSAPRDGHADLPRQLGPVGPGRSDLAKHREALKERWRRRFGTPIAVWVAEFQNRGAPHLHLYIGLPDAVSESEYIDLQKRTVQRRSAERRIGAYKARAQIGAPSGEFAQWLRKAWWEIVGSGLKAHHGRGVDIAAAFYSAQAESQANRVRVAEYFWRESGKWKQKQPPEGFGGMNFYGRWGKKEGFNPIVTEEWVNERAWYDLRRMVRRMMLGKMRRRPSEPAGRCPAMPEVAGRDGLTVSTSTGRRSDLASSNVPNTLH